MVVDETEIPPAVLIPWYLNKGLNPSQQTLKFMNDQKDLYKAMLGGHDLPQPAKHKRFEKRYDFMLQEKGLETFLKLKGQLTSHTAYWTSKDAISFVLMKIKDEKIKVKFDV